MKTAAAIFLVVLAGCTANTTQPNQSLVGLVRPPARLVPVTDAFTPAAQVTTNVTAINDSCRRNGDGGLEYCFHLLVIPSNLVYTLTVQTNKLPAPASAGWTDYTRYVTALVATGALPETCISLYGIAPAEFVRVHVSF